MPTVLLVRHGRTTANASAVLAGWTPGVELDDTGRSQVASLARRVQALPVVRIVTSPLTRCLQTTDILRTGAWADVPVQEREDLGECHYGAWTGRPLAELARDPLWAVVQNHPSAAVFPGSEEYRSESVAHMAARAVAAVREVDADIEVEHGADALWVAVTHGDVVKAILADAVGTHLDHFQRIAVGPASLAVVRYTPERPYLLRAGDGGDDLGGLVPRPVPGPAGGTAGVVGGGA